MAFNPLKCQVCGQTKEWHLEHRPRHKFSTESGAIQEESKAPVREPKMQMGVADPVLRIALIQAGVLRPSDIDTAQKAFDDAKATGNPIIASPALVGHSDGSDSSAGDRGGARGDLRSSGSRVAPTQDDAEDSGVEDSPARQQSPRSRRWVRNRPLDPRNS